MKLMVINDGENYYLAEEINHITAKEHQEKLRNGELTISNPIFRFTFLDKFRNAYYELGK